eukprot:EG_transcript_2712
MLDEEQPQDGQVNVYVTGLPLKITPKKFRQLFSPFGSIIATRVVPRRKGFSPVGFVQYTHPAMAHAAVAAMHGTAVEGYTLSASLAKRDKDKGLNCPPSSKLYVANLPKRFGEAEVQAIFSRFGPLQSIRMLRTQGVRGALGTALVTFENVEDAIQAKEVVHCAQLPGDEPLLEVKFAETSQCAEERKANSSHKSTKSKEPRKAGDMSHILEYVAGVLETYKKTKWEAEAKAQSRPCAWMHGWGCLCADHHPVWPTCNEWVVPSANGSATANAAAVYALTEYMQTMSGQKPRESRAEALSGSHSGSSGSFGHWDSPRPDLKADADTAPAGHNPSPRSPPAQREAKEKSAAAWLEDDLYACIARLDATQLAQVSSVLDGPWLEMATCAMSNQALNCP